MRLIDKDDLLCDMKKHKAFGELSAKSAIRKVETWQTVDAIPVEQLLSILPKYDDYIHMKTYPYNETMEDIYSQGYEDGWNVCLKHIKEELNYWEKENETN